ncbi:hypothetical protein MKX41_00210 [Paenibacillus sp. FSL R5-0475]|uniref:DUF7878 domain-containing protein n=1 Tax=Paenibacillus sp. FSL R5-0475 TaxID=2921643 RepID=UPI0030F4FC56
MDFLSDKVTIIFHFSLGNDKEIERELVLAKNFKLLADIEGEIEIIINNKIFFSEKYLLLLEFGIELKKWWVKVKSNEKTSFSYETMSFNEGPILEFAHIAEGKWRIFSQWQKFDCNQEIPQKVLMNSVEKFLGELESQFVKLYSLRINDFIAK